MHREANLKILV